MSVLSVMLGIICSTGPFCVVPTVYLFSLLIILVRLSVPVQVIDWKDSSGVCTDHLGRFSRTVMELVRHVEILIFLTQHIVTEHYTNYCHFASNAPVVTNANVLEMSVVNDSCCD